MKTSGDSRYKKNARVYIQGTFHDDFAPFII